MSLVLDFASAPPDDPSTPGEVAINGFYIAQMCSSSFGTATWTQADQGTATNCITNIVSVSMSQITQDTDFIFGVDVVLSTGPCPPKGLPVVVIAVIIVCCIVVLLVIVGIFVYMRYRKRYAQGAFNKQFERENEKAGRSTTASYRLDRTNTSSPGNQMSGSVSVNGSVALDDSSIRR